MCAHVSASLHTYHFIWVTCEEVLNGSFVEAVLIILCLLHSKQVVARQQTKEKHHTLCIGHH